jgi:hypothetical protein
LTDVALSLKIGEGYTDQIDPVRKEIAPGIIELSAIPPGEITLWSGSMTAQGGSFVSRAKTINLSGDTELDFSLQGDPANVSGVILSSQFSQVPASASPAPPGQAPPDRPLSDQATPDQAPVIKPPEDSPPDVTITFRSLKTGNTAESYDATVSSDGKFCFAGSTLPAGSYEVEFPPQSGL